MVCKRCKTLMYPHGDDGGPNNHRKGTCADGVKAARHDIAWPQPTGIFTNPKQKLHFHVIPFLQQVQVLYNELVTNGRRHEDLDVDMQTLCTVLSERMRHEGPGDSGKILFALFPDVTIADRSAYEVYIETLDDGKEYLRIDCLATPQ